jgi:hypothetical protein
VKEVDMPTTDTDDYMLTTIDNPWNPFTHWDEWYAWDYAKGYHTPEYLARITKFSFDLSEADQDLAIREAIDEIVEMNILGVYRKIKRTDKINL